MELKLNLIENLEKYLQTNINYLSYVQHEKGQSLQSQNTKNDQVTIRHRSDLMGDIDENEGYMRNKWLEQEMIQTRRSVSSSPSSESENNDMQDESKHQQKMPSSVTATSHQTDIPNSVALRPDDIIINDNVQDMITSFSAPQQTIQHQSGQLSQFNIPNENGPVSLFPPSTGNLNTQIPFPSPGAAMFPPTFVNAFSSVATNAQPTSKHGETLITNSSNNSINYPSNLCAAAFTSSSRNMALTTSMMAPSPVQTDLSSIPPVHNNDMSQISSHLSGNNNNNNISSSTKIDFNREYKIKQADLFYMSYKFNHF